MAWNSPTTWIANTVLTAAQLNQQVRDNFKAIGDPWTAYTPTFSASGTPASLGNGTAVGAFSEAGKRIHFRAKITMGSTTTYGTGALLIGLPRSPINTVTDAIDITSMLWDTSASARRLWPVYISASQGVVADPSGTLVSGTAPWTWANGDIISIAGTYEAA